MRPRKRVLLWAEEGRGLEVVKFAMDVRGLHARAVATVDEFRQQLDEFGPDGAVLFVSWNVAGARACERAAQKRQVRTMVVLRCDRSYETVHAGNVLQPGANSMTEIMQSTLTLVAHKRGPKRSDEAFNVKLAVASAGAELRRNERLA